MKQCPWCQSEVGYFQFISRYGSDTLVKHKSSGHPQEHRCGRCGKIFSIFYHPRNFAKIFPRCLLGAAAAAILVSFLLFYPGTSEKILPLAGSLFVLFLIPAASYAKYESSEIKSELL